jgi:prevent-host-death family protein
MDVTAKELKLRLGKYLAKVESGETVRVTKRGKVVAELCSPALSAKDKLDRLVAQGRATRGNGEALRPHTGSPARLSGTAIILADREDERL